MKAEVNKLKDELAPVYKDKARLTEELMQCRESLGRVRDINEKHSKALDEATGRIRDLQSRNKELSQQVDNERATQAVAVSELEVLCTRQHCVAFHRHSPYNLRSQSLIPYCMPCTLLVHCIACSLPDALLTASMVTIIPYL